MPNYKLTTDLIADCMALIPQNLELLNNHGFYFEKVDSFYEVELPSASNCRLSFYDARQAELSFIIASHCLRNIPEFQVELPQEVDFFELHVGDCIREFYMYAKVKEETTNQTEWAVKDLHREYKDKLKLPRTIASATFWGNGTFPNTFEKLCESYKNVMSK
jgi:hypothetical protein